MSTPSLVVDADIVRRNLKRMADFGAAHKINIRPHTKTHKSQFIGRLQIENGCQGLTVAKVGEAKVMSQVSDDLLLAYPALDPVRANAAAQLARTNTLRVAVDSEYAARVLSDAAKLAGSTLGMLVDLDVGLHRTGVQSPQLALELARAISKLPNLRLDGLFCYPGQVWDKPDHQAESLKKVDALLQETLDLWRRDGLSAQIVSGGSTPSALQSNLVRQYTEIRPGTYVFNDLNTVRGGFCNIEDCAARIHATVISTAVPNQVVLDSGSKTLTSDRLIPQPDAGHGYIVEYPHAVIRRLSEEHAQVEFSSGSRRPELGERVTIIPNHICPCVNLQDELWWRESDGSIRPIRVDARGKLS
ncbi:MAG: alanine racemase [Phycisphaerales bacterium]|nr:alanine racemase [Phycisphaerales bacterium]